MALNNTQTNFGYDHPAYLARGTWNATMAAGASGSVRFVAHANLQLMAVTATLGVAGTSTYTRTQFYNQGTNSLTVHVANNQYTVTRLTNTAASGAAAAFSTSTLAVFSPDIFNTVNAGTGTGVVGSWFIQSLNSSTGSAGLYGAAVNQGDILVITGGTDATAVGHFVVDFAVQPLANVIA